MLSWGGGVYLYFPSFASFFYVCYTVPSSDPWCDFIYMINMSLETGD